LLVFKVTNIAAVWSCDLRTLLALFGTVSQNFQHIMAKSLAEPDINHLGDSWW